MENVKQNKMADMPMKKLFWKMGLPMIISMVLQALYNVVDSIFVTNMGEQGAIANQALTLAFPIQILIIAIGVGTGIGLNTLLSKNLGENNKEQVNKVAGNGIFISICIFILFFLFGMFGSKWFISLFSAGNEEIISIGTTYLKICCCFSLGSIAYTAYERFLQATGKTNLSAIAQISGAIANIVLDYIFIFPLNMGVAGAAWATVIGQFLSLFVAIIFHYTVNKEIDKNLKYIKPDLGLIRGIYSIGLSAAIMQSLLSVMMAGMNAILGTAKADPTILVGSFGIYYKIQNIAVLACFGLSNTIITILSFNYGMKDKKRADDCIKYGIIDTAIVTLIITALFEIFANPLSKLFGLSGGSTTQIIDVCSTALRISSIGFVFMGFSIAVQGVLQALRYACKPLIISLLRLVIFVFPIAYLFTLSDNVINLVWWTFPISEILTAIISAFILKNAYKQKIAVLEPTVYKDNLVISISREHGTNGKEIARNVAKQLGIAFYGKEEIKDFAIKHSLVENYNDTDKLYNDFLSLEANGDSIIKQTNVIKEIANTESCVIVGRSADYILRDNKDLIKIFLYAPEQYKIDTIKRLYNDDDSTAKSYMEKSDKARSTYYEVISNQIWGNKNNYDICLDCQIGNDEIVKIICNYVKNKIKN